MESAANHPVSFRIPAWVSFRTYVTSAECRAMVSNECTHQTVFLEGSSAAVWKMIEDGAASIQELFDLAKTANLGLSHAELRDFTELLHADGFIAEPKNYDRYGKVAKGPPRNERIENSPHLNVMRQFMNWIKQNNFLYSVHWEITWRCNEKCIHCYNPGAAHFDDEKPDRETEELTLEQIHKVLLDLKEIGVSKITYSGGDPFVRRDFFEILAITRELGFAVDVYTNALLLKPEAMERLLGLYPSCIGVSVYSANASVHDEVTKVPGSFDKSVAALRQLNRLGVRTVMKSIQMKHTVHGWRKAALLADELGAGAEIDFGLTAGADGSSAPLDHAITDLGHLVVVSLMKDSPLYVGSPSEGFHAIVRERDESVCGAGLSSIGIDPEGTVVPCLSLPLASGNLKTDSVVDIWRRGHAPKKELVADGDLTKTIRENPYKVLARWQQITLKDYTECGTHDRCIWCQRCPGMSMSESGNPLLPASTNCRNAAARMIAAGLAKSGVSKEDACKLFGLDPAFGDHADQYKPANSPDPENRRDPGFNPRLVGLEAIGCSSTSTTTASSIKEIKVPIHAIGIKMLNRGASSLRESDELIQKLKIDEVVKRHNFVE